MCIFVYLDDCLIFAQTEKEFSLQWRLQGNCPIQFFQSVQISHSRLSVSNSRMDTEPPWMFYLFCYNQTFPSKKHWFDLLASIVDVKPYIFLDQVGSLVFPLPFTFVDPGRIPTSDRSLACGLGFQSLPDWVGFPHLGFPTKSITENSSCFLSYCNWR